MSLHHLESSDASPLRVEELRLPGVEFGSLLGTGASTAVYRARYRGRDCAVKVMQRATAGREYEEFCREAAVVARLGHPGLPTVHEVGSVAGRPYLVMDLVDGTTLGRVLSGGPLDAVRTARLGAEIAEVLHVAHAAGLVHRDVKPDNVMVRPDGSACLLDFGLATRATEHADGADVAVGTFRYSAPEQSGALRREVDGRADLYSLGVVLFECLAGVPPFDVQDVGELITMHLSAPPPDLTRMCPGAAPALVSVIAKLMAKDPDDRYLTAAALGADLRRIAAGAHDPFPLGTASEEIRSERPLVGRTAERAALAERWQRAITGSGDAVLLAGAAGTGKTRLVRQFADDVRQAGHPVLFGVCTDETVPLAPLRDAVDRYLETVDRSSGPVREAARERIRAAAAATGGLAAALSPALADLLGGTPARPAEQQDQFCAAVALLFTGLAEQEGGAVLLLDDVHRADPLTREVIRHLGALLPTASLLVVTTARDDVGTAGKEMWLGPLDHAGTAELIRAELGAAEVPAPLVDKVVTRSGGNPMAVVECLSAVLEAGLLRPSWGSWVLDESRLEALALPESILDLILRRMDRLGDGDREMLTVAAVVGASFPADVVAVAGDVPEPVALVALNAATTAGVLEPRDAGEYAFVHEGLRQFLLSALDETRRRQLHQRVAEALHQRAGAHHNTVYQLATHYLAGDWRVDPRATMTAAVDAGLLALDQHATATALQMLTDAERVAGECGLEVTADLSTAIGVAAMRADRYELAHTHLDRALDTERDPLRRARIYLYKSATYTLRHLGDQAVDMVRGAYAELGRPVPRHPGLLALSTLGLAAGGFLLGLTPLSWREARGPRREFFELYCELSSVGGQAAAMAMNQPLMAMLDLRALPAANRLGRGREYVIKRGGLAVISAAVAGRRGWADRRLRDGSRVANEIGDPTLLAWLRWIGGIAHDSLGDRDAHHNEQMRIAVEEYGQWLNLGEYASGVAMLGHHALLRGDADQAERWYRCGEARMPSEDEVLGSIFATLDAQVAALRGQPGPATARLAAVERQLADMPQKVAEWVTLAIARVHLAVELGELDELDSAYARAAEQLDALGISPAACWAYQRPLWLYHAFGRLQHALQAAPQQRPARLAAAATAVRLLGKAAKGVSLRAYHTVAVASLMQLRGDNRRALRRLRGLRDRIAGIDAPGVEFELFTVRARAHRALGNTPGAHRDASAAAAIAARHGWALRAQRTRTEFGLVSRDPTHRRHTQSVSVVSPPGGFGALHQRRLEALHDVSLAAATVFDPAELTRIALDEMVRIFTAERAFLFHVEPDTDELVPYLGRDLDGNDLVELTGHSSTLVEQVHRGGQPLVVTGTDHGVALGSQSAMVHGLRSIMIVPLHVKGRRQGVVYLDSRVVKGVFTPDDVELLGAIANHVALSMETARAAQLELAVRTAQHDRDMARTLHQAMTEIAGTLDPDEVASRSVTTVRRVLDASAAVLLRLTTPGEVEVVRVTADGTSDATSSTDVDLVALVSDPQAGHIASHDGRPAPAILGRDVTSWLAVPVALRGERHGLLLAGAGDGRTYAAAEGEQAVLLAGHTATALENARLFRHAEELATTDGLTGLFNRRHFFGLARTHLEVHQRSGRHLAALMLDIDHFKKINDTYGHAVGDEVIREVGRRLATTLRSGDILCRYGGEEFAVLLTEAVGAPEAYLAATRLHGAVTAAPIMTASGPLPVTVSVGLAGPTASPSLEILLKLADEALYVAKRNGRDQVHALDG